MTTYHHANVIDTGHFALEDSSSFIAGRMRKFLGQNAAPGSAKCGMKRSKRIRADVNGTLSKTLGYYYKEKQT